MNTVESGMITTRACDNPPVISTDAGSNIAAVVYDILSRNPARFGASFAAGRAAETPLPSAPARTSDPIAPGRAAYPHARRAVPQRLVAAVGTTQEAG